MLRLVKKFKQILRKMFPYVELRIEGAAFEQFINICLRRKIDIWNVEIKADKVILCMSAKSFKKNVRSIVRKTGVKVKILRKDGVPLVLKRYRFRIPLVMYVLMGALAVTYCSSFVWNINIVGGNIEEKDAVAAFLEREQVKVGSSLHSIETKALGNKILLSVDSLKWVTISKKGTVLNIELLSKDAYREEEGIIDGPRSIVAKKDALIKKIVAESGTAVMLENNVVLKGETIISGYVYPIDEIYGTEPREVSAKGDVIGVVRYSANVPVETEADVYKLSGKTQTERSLKIFGKNILLSKRCDFKQFNKIVSEDRASLDVNHILPISVVKTEYFETECETVTFNEEEAIDYASLKAMQLLDDKIPDDANVVATGSELKVIDGLTCYCIWAECEESVGEYVPLHLEN